MELKFNVFLVIFIAAASSLTGGCWCLTNASTVLTDVPAYQQTEIWDYNGCGPASIASILAYWDKRGYRKIFSPAGEALQLTTNISEEFNATLDFLDFGYSKYRNTGYPGSMIGYILERYSDVTGGYGFYAVNRSFGPSVSSRWDLITNEIDSGRPLIFSFDTNGDESTDHFAPVIGYDDSNPEDKKIALYTNWEEAENVHWHTYQGMSDIQGTSQWGVSGIIVIQPVSPCDSWDTELDGDVDGLDLHAYISSFTEADLESFATEYGRTEPLE